MSDIDVVLERLVSDDAFRRAFAAAPARELDRYDLTAQQREMLLVQVSPDATIGSGVERRTSKAGMFALLGEAAQFLGHSDSATLDQLRPVPPAGAPDHTLALADQDITGDGLGLAQETTLDTNADIADADGDGLLDSEEGVHHTDPLDPDSDNDGLSDGQELVYHTDPTQRDTDHDGIIDSTEAWKSDSDHDGLPDLTELKLGTDPFNADTDGDGLWDANELAHHTDPLDPDSDNDGLTDFDEVQGDSPEGSWIIGENATSPNDPDSDDDGLLDGAEKALGTDPHDPDTDNDFASDGYEVAHGTDPLDPGTAMVHAGAPDGSPTSAMSPANTAPPTSGDQTLIAFEHGTRNHPVDAGDVYDDPSEPKPAATGQRSHGYGGPDTKPVESGYGVPDTHPVDDEQRAGAAPEPRSSGR